MARKTTRWLFAAIQVAGAVCSIGSFLRGLQLLVIDISNWTGLVWLAAFVLLAATAVSAGRRASPLLRQSGTERGHWRTEEVEVFYPIPYKSAPRLRLSKLHLRGGFGNPVDSNALRNREVVATQQEKEGFTAAIRGTRSSTRSGSYNWRFRWKAIGIPDI